MELNELEKEALAGFRDNQPPSVLHIENDLWWLRFSLYAVLNVGRMARAARIDPKSLQKEKKSDGTPATNLEREMEVFVHDLLHQMVPQAVFVGEETGGEFSEEGYVVAMDPVDGTWSFISHLENCATLLTVFRDGEPIVGVVMNPATGEIGYAGRRQPTRLIQLGVSGELDRAIHLPTQKKPGAALVNIHPSQQAAGSSIVQALYGHWQANNIQMVRSSGGSPAWALLEAAKGYYTYINLWSKQPAECFDLAGALLLVRQAGGEVFDKSGKPIRYVGHSAPFIASVYISPDEGFIKDLRAILQ